MKFNLAAAAITGGVGLAVLLCGAGILNMIFEGYGQAFIDLFASIYPGYDGNGFCWRSCNWLLVRCV